MTRVLVEIMTGKPPKRPDSPSVAALREQLRREVDEIKARGGIVDIPPEIA